MISLIQKKENMTGMSILVPSLFSIDISCIKVGKLFCIKKGILSNADTDLKPVFTIDTRNADIWSGSPKNYKSDPNKRENELMLIKKSTMPEDSFLSLLTDRNKTVFQLKAKEILTNSVKTNNGEITGLENLIGLGQGLTPSGDDFISGALLAGEILNGSIQINKERIKGRLETTTFAGRTLLYCALEGSFPAYLLSFVNEISGSLSDDEYLKALEKVSKHGSTSGRDTIAGFYWYENCLINYEKIV